MCITRSWKSIESTIDSETIVARRSDGVNFKFFKIEFDNRDPILTLVQRLEEFRNCKCLPNAPCSKHIEESERINANS